MSLCKYFLNGNCRYGENCRFSHATDTRPSHYQQHQYRPQPQYRPQQQQQRHHHYQQQQFRHPRPHNDQRFSFVAATNSDNNNNTNQSRPSQVFQPAIQWARTNFSDSEYALDILQQLQKEARVWLKSSALWRFTTKSIYPGGQPLPDWQDFSFEEVRWEYYMKKNLNQEHLYKKACQDYWEATERQLVGLSRLRVETLNIFKPYIEQCIHMKYHPKKTLETDVDMENSTGVQNPYPTATMTMASGSTPLFHHEQPSAHYTPDDVLLDDERAAFSSDSFEFGNIPLQAPSIRFS